MKKNIVIINPDQMRADTLHHLGNEASSTPYMDRLASEGVSFSNCHCQNPVCVPSRSSFLTGLYPHVHGHRTQGHLLRSGESNLFGELKKNGYYVWANDRGDMLAGQDDEWLKQNFDVLYSEPGKEAGTDEGRGKKGDDRYFSFYRGVINTNGQDTTIQDGDMVWTMGAIEHIHNRPKDKPMALFLGFADPHPPYRAEQKYIDRIDTSQLPSRIPSIKETDGKPSMEAGLLKGLGVKDWDEKRFNQLRTVYLAMCSRVDDKIGMVIDALKAEGIYEDTAIFILSDHGDYTGDYGLVEKAQNTFEDCLTNVPLIIKPPKGEKVDKGINTNLVELIDFYATVIHYAQYEPERDHFGISLHETIGDKTVEVRSAVFCEGGRRHGELHCVEGGGLTDMVDDYEPRMELQASEGPEHTKAVMVRTKEFKYVRRLYEQDEFYALQEPTAEQVNLINDPRYTAEISKLKEILADWYLETCDVVPRNQDSRMSNEYMIKVLSQSGIPVEYLRDEIVNKKKPMSEVVAGFMKFRK